ncbi:Uncharacterized protein HSRCO_1780 [Halanaeroarchaeum sp. HSR-CO]|uniref:hypothetical protein n=1 Tax=Halanaeroarchaeum sp. HSR-CO TaxID=2866382 RepID=UPI00217F0939|nr:hypothetical protein [Halanaeroarchaeum sp. HSR-CO]UWG48057.1 Uncharacterized protein HSRCO_1780 [Halanaeroarchaeum sp. HSR-CO]
MNRTHVVGGVLVVLVLALGIGAAVLSGVGPAPGGNGSGDTLSEFPTETPTETPATAAPGDEPSRETATDDGTTEEATTQTPPFTFTIDDIEECGTTCRDVTATLTNEQDDTATGVTVYTRVYAGEDTTEENDIVWEGREDVGTLEGGEAHTTTRRVELSLLDARKVNQRDGWITIVTTVQTDDRTVTFRDSEQVA